LQIASVDGWWYKNAMSRSKNAKSGQPEVRRSPCPVTSTLDIFGDKWTLIVVRDLLLGKRLYREFSESPEGIPTNILADRLKRLEAEGVVTREPYQQRPLRYAYQLTEKGEDLLPVLAEIARWANHYIPGTAKPPAVLVQRLAKVRKRRGW
jgi:DNA-binding HxlR family transcriptional regulator